MILKAISVCVYTYVYRYVYICVCIMTKMTQKKLKKPYFHCGSFWKGKYQNEMKDFKVTNIKNK